MEIALDTPSLDGGQPSARFGETVTVSLSATPRDLPLGFDDLAAAQAGLDAHLERRLTTMAEQTSHHATIARLEMLVGGQGEAAANLAAFEAEEADAIRRWASTPSDEPPPAPRVERRAELAEALKIAEQRAAAARSAQTGAHEEMARLGRMIIGFDHEIAACKLSVLNWTAQPVVARAKETVEQLKAELFDLDAIANLMLDEADAAKKARNPMEPIMRAKAVAFASAAAFAGPFLSIFVERPIAGMARNAAAAAAHATWRDFLDTLTKEPTDEARTD